MALCSGLCIVDLKYMGSGSDKVWVFRPALAEIP